MQLDSQSQLKANSSSIKVTTMKCSIRKIMHISAIAFGLAGAAQAQAHPASSPLVQGGSPNRVGTQFDFKYTSTDARFNVFDDGQNTRVLMPEGSLIPVITTLKPAGEVLLTPKVDGTALVLEGIHSGLKLIWANGKTVSIQYQGPSDAIRQGRAAAFGAVATQAQFQSMAAPIKTSALDSENANVTRDLALIENKRVEMLERYSDSRSQEAADRSTALPPSASMVPLTDNTVATSPVKASDASVVSVVVADAAPSQKNESEAQVPTPTGKPERLLVMAGQRLSVALSVWLKSQNIDLSWEAPGSLPGRMREVVLESTWTAAQTSLVPTLREVLAPFGLEAHVLVQDTPPGSQPRAVVVRNASGARP